MEKKEEISQGFGKTRRKKKRNFPRIRKDEEEEKKEEEEEEEEKKEEEEEEEGEKFPGDSFLWLLSISSLWLTDCRDELHGAVSHHSQVVAYAGRDEDAVSLSKVVRLSVHCEFQPPF
ncbi:MAG: hypothetical protein O3B01_06350 [Planctomycetota bacterium]|nr:hypothetical protein [Planctomycetota bacterium]